MLTRVLVAFAVLGGLSAVTTSSGIRWQHTESLPIGLYRLHRARPIARGSVVLWCLDSIRGHWARSRGYLTRGACPGRVEALGKVVLGLVGDTIDWSIEGVRRNGHLLPHTQPIRQDRAGRSLTPMPFGRYVVAPGMAWLYSPYSIRSLDSRYFGVVPLTWSRGVLTRVPD